MIRFDKISLFEVTNKIVYDNPRIEYDDSLTDKSFFIPTSEAIKSLSPLSDSDKSQFYDFVNGHDGGGNPPPSRRPGMDLAELSTHIRHEQENLEEAAHKALTEKRRKADFERRVAALAATNPNVDTTTSAPPPTNT